MLWLKSDDKETARPVYILPDRIEEKLTSFLVATLGHTVQHPADIQQDLSFLRRLRLGWQRTCTMLWELLIKTIYGLIATIFGFGMWEYLQ